MIFHSLAFFLPLHSRPYRARQLLAGTMEQWMIYAPRCIRTSPSASPAPALSLGACVYSVYVAPGSARLSRSIIICIKSGRL